MGDDPGEGIVIEARPPLPAHRGVVLAAVLTALVGAAGARAALPGEERIELRSDCPRRADDTCFTDLTTLDRWLWHTRRPSAEHAAVVHVGPGTFRGRLRCIDAGHVRFVGASGTTSILLGSVDEPPFATVHAKSCEALAFEQLTIRAPHSRTRRGKAVYFEGTGSSEFSAVRLEAEYIAFYDDRCPTANGEAATQQHDFAESVLEAGAVGVFSKCGALRLTDTTLEVEPGPDTYLPFLSRKLARVAVGVKASHRSRVELTRCRVRVDARATGPVDQTLGLLAGADGTLEHRGWGHIDMRGDALEVRGHPSGATHAARAELYGRPGANARIRMRGVILTLDPPNAPVSAGTGQIERSPAEHP